MANYTLSLTDGEGSVSFVSHEGVLVTVPSDHDNFARITQALINDEDPSVFLDVTKAVQGIDGRVTVTDHDVYFEGAPVHGTVVTTILRFRREGRDTTGLVRFLERLQKNPSRHSREQLFTWLERQGLNVDPDGNILAFKAVQLRPVPDDEFYGDIELGSEDDPRRYPFQSISTGTALVDGERYEGNIPNGVGAVVSMDRREVDDDFSTDCSYGLHIGSYSYASSFGPYLTEVKVAPEDVVSVPRYDTQKMRCCRYEVLAIQKVKRNDLTHWESPSTWNEDEAYDEIGDVLEEDGAPTTWVQRFRRKLFGTSEES